MRGHHSGIEVDDQRIVTIGAVIGGGGAGLLTSTLPGQQHARP